MSQVIKAEKEANEQLGFFEQLHLFLRRNVNYLMALCLLLLMVQDFFGTHGILDMMRSKEEASSDEQQINQISDENRQLQEKIESLKSDPQAIERIAREEMGLAKPGEYIFKVQPKTGDSATQKSATPEQNR
jgi:cell division protein FtsB